MKAAMLFLVVIASASSTMAAAEPLKIFLFTNQVPSGSTDEQLNARRESLQDLVKTLSSPRYQKTLSLVKSRGEAEVVVELVARGETTTGAASGSTRSSGGATTSASRSTSVTKQFLKFRIAIGQQPHELITEDQLAWPKMAERAAEDLVRWIESSARPQPQAVR